MCIRDSSSLAMRHCSGKSLCLPDDEPAGFIVAVSLSDKLGELEGVNPLSLPPVSFVAFVLCIRTIRVVIRAQRNYAVVARL